MGSPTESSHRCAKAGFAISGGAALKGVGRGLENARKAIGGICGRKVARGGSAVVKAGPRFGTHVLERMRERGITPKMVEKALEKGQQFWDPKNKVINHVLRGGFASGKDLLVGRNPVTGTITTAIRGNDLIRPRFVPIK